MSFELCNDFLLIKEIESALSLERNYAPFIIKPTEYNS